MALVKWSRFTCEGRREEAEWWESELHTEIKLIIWSCRLWDIYLSWCIRADELFVDLLGFEGHFWWFGGLVVLTSQVEGNVFLTELWDQECSEQAQSVWAQGRKKGELTSRKKPGVTETSASGVMWSTHFDWTAVCQTTPSISKARRHLTCRKRRKTSSFKGQVLQDRIDDQLVLRWVNWQA